MTQNLFAANVSARDVGYNMVQCISGRHTLTAADTPAATKIGRLPAGAVITGISSRVVTAVTGGTPVLGIGTTAALVGTNGNINAVMAEAAGSENVVPSATVVQPLAADTDLFVGTTGAATAGDVVVVVSFVKP
jgi:hypothetical protein